MQPDKLLTVAAVLTTSVGMYGFVYVQCKSAISSLLIPHLPLKEDSKERETKGYFTLLNLVYFVFIVNALVHAVEDLAALQIATTLKGLQAWADITGSQLFWLGALVLGFVITLFILKTLFSEQQTRHKQPNEPW
jgi:hypothetical protein